MASYCACCGKPLGFGGAQGTVNHLGQKLKLCELCSDSLQEVEQAVAQSDCAGFERQSPRLEARIVPRVYLRSEKCRKFRKKGAWQGAKTRQALVACKFE